MWGASSGIHEVFDRLFKFDYSTGGYVPRHIDEIPVAYKNANFGNIEGPFIPFDVDQNKKKRYYNNVMEDLVHKYGRPDPERVIPQAKELSYIDKKNLLRDPRQVSAEDFFAQQADRFDQFTKRHPGDPPIKPSGFYNEAVHTLDQDINDRIAGVFTDPNNPNEAILNFARERGLPIFALAKGAEDLPGQTGKEFWADLFKKSGPESGEWVPTRISTGVGKTIRENQDMIMDHFRRMGMLTPDPVSGVTGEGGMKDVIRWIKTYGFADMLSHLSREEKEALRTPGMTYSILPDEVRDALNRSVKQNQKSIGSYFQSSLMPTNRKLHYTGEDFPWE